MKLLAVLFAVTLAACGKANDVPALRAETEGLLKNYDARFADLSRRADAIMQRGNAIGVTSPDAANASRMFAAAKGKLEQLKAEVKNGPGELGRIKDRLEVRRYFDRMQHQLETGFTEINADFDAVESWIALAEARPAQVAQREQPRDQPVVPPPPTPAPDAPPVPGNPGQPGQSGAGGTAPNPPR